MIELTDQQRGDLERRQAVEVRDPQTNALYVLVHKDVYERLKSLLYHDGDLGDEELRLLLARSAADNGWDEPAMDAYDRYDEELRRRCP
jgi:hypothetical protein